MDTIKSRFWLGAIAVAICLSMNSAVIADEEATLDQLFQYMQESDSKEKALGFEKAIVKHFYQAPDADAGRQLEDAISALAVDDLARAEAVLTGLTGSYPDYAEAWNKLATVAFLQKKYGLAKAHIEKVLKLEPRHFGALSTLGNIYEAEGKFTEALRTFEHVLEIHPFMRSALQKREELQRRLRDKAI